MMSAAIYARYKNLMLVEPPVRKALFGRHEWMFHDTPYEAMQKIRFTELEVRDPGVIDRQLLDLIDQTLGRGARSILCLKPASSPVAAKVNVTSSLSKDERVKSIPWEGGRVWWFADRADPKKGNGGVKPPPFGYHQFRWVVPTNQSLCAGETQTWKV
jgi:hypothetical protein